MDRTERYQYGMVQGVVPPTLPSQILKVTGGHACMLSSTASHLHSHKQLPFDSGVRENSLEAWLALWANILGSGHKGLSIRLQSLEKEISVS